MTYIAIVIAFISLLLQPWSTISAGQAGLFASLYLGITTKT